MAVFCVSSPLKGRASRRGKGEASGPGCSGHFHGDRVWCRCLDSEPSAWKAGSFFLQIGVASGKKSFLGCFPAGFQGGPGIVVPGGAILSFEGEKANRNEVQRDQFPPFFFFFFIFHGDRVGQRVHISPYYSEIPMECSCVSRLVPCWLVPCWSCLLASETTWRHMYPQCLGTAWSPALYSWRAPCLTAENRAGQGWF